MSQREGLDARDESLSEYVRETVSERAKAIFTVVIDATFTVVVVLINYGASYLLEPVDLAGVDLVVARSLQWMFGVSTLGVVFFFLIKDLVTAFQRVVRNGKR